MVEDLVPCSQHDVEEDQFFESCSSTQIEFVKLRHTWTINNFSRLCFSEFEDELVSPTFSAGINSNKSEWCLTLSQCKCMKYENEDYDCPYYDIVCNLKLVRSRIPINVWYELRIDNAKYKFATISSWKEFEINQYSDFLCIFKRNTAMLCYDGSDRADIVCKISYDGSNGDISKPLKTPQSALAMDFAFLLENKQLSDVTLCVSGREFPAHKVILSVRSPVFRVMFQHDTEENRNNRVEITDMNEEVLGEMLRYMYTGKINKWEEMAPYLLGIAEKYDLEELKIRCEEALSNSLSLENVVKFFILSDMFHVKNLNIQVKRFIEAHVSVVIIRPEFQTMNETHPHLGKMIIRLKQRADYLQHLAEKYNLEDLKIESEEELLESSSSESDECDTYSSSERFYDKVSKRKTSKSKRRNQKR